MNGLFLFPYSLEVLRSHRCLEPVRNRIDNPVEQCRAAEEGQTLELGS
jgi:hypothetical protein